MSKKRRVHSADFKLKVALEALKEQKTMSQIAQEHNLHANQITDWKKTVITHGTSLFGGQTAPPIIDTDTLLAPYLEQIGTLQMELGFLKKKLKQLGTT